jgi:hypothetical protein
MVGNSSSRFPPYLIGKSVDKTVRRQALQEN